MVVVAGHLHLDEVTRRNRLPCPIDDHQAIHLGRIASGDVLPGIVDVVEFLILDDDVRIVRRRGYGNLRLRVLPAEEHAVRNVESRADGVEALSRLLLLRLRSPQGLAAAIKALPLTLTATRPVAEAISSAGGVDFAALGEGYMLTPRPGVFAAGEMLDWEAPTGGYLLQATFSSAVCAAEGALTWLRR